jgi:hypothetical protein
MKKNDRGRKGDHILLVSGSAELPRDGVSWLGISTKDECRRFMRASTVLVNYAVGLAAREHSHRPWRPIAVGAHTGSSMKP